MYLKSNISLLIFHLDDLFIVESVILKSSTTFALLSVFAIRSANICLIFRYSSVRYTYVYNLHTFDESIPLSLYSDLLCLLLQFLT